MVNYLTLGYDCSTATTLRNLELRKYALPFDWVVSSRDALTKCINDDFKSYHKDLKLHTSKNKLVDSYGFEFPHDYPTITSSYTEDIEIYNEDNIVDNWIEYHPVVLDKYNRRIERFLEIVNCKKPIITLYRGRVDDAIFLKELLINKYDINIIKFVVATLEKTSNSDVFVCNPESQGDWNNIEIWKNTLNLAIKSI